jgi:hypothetical protein
LAAHLLVSQLDLGLLTAEKLCEVAKVSIDSGEITNAMNALVAALSIDEKHIESWLLLARFDKLPLEVIALLPKTAPIDSRVHELPALWKRGAAFAS